MNLVRVRAKASMNHRAVQSKVQQGTFRSLGHAGAAIRLTAVRSIRKRKKPSRPGAPPHTPTGHLKRVIRYDVDQQQTEVLIGPTNEYTRTIWNLHEFGGSAEPRPKLLKRQKLQVGDYGPVRRSAAMLRDQGGRFVRRGEQFARVKLTTQAQADRATRLVENENALRIADAKKRRHYPKRPFMGPALQRMESRLPSFWKNSVKA